MYGALWRVLPGPTWFKVIQMIILFGLVIFFLFNWGYPFIVNYFGLTEATV